jgi:glutamate/tyrosine decarboxylase-like PLP-dependent enzyme
VIFTSDQGHYSLKKNAALMGIGTNSIIMIRSDQYGRMDAIDLEHQIQKSIEQ